MGQGRDDADEQRRRVDLQGLLATNRPALEVMAANHQVDATRLAEAVLLLCLKRPRGFEHGYSWDAVAAVAERVAQDLNLGARFGRGDPGALEALLGMHRKQIEYVFHH